MKNKKFFNLDHAINYLVEGVIRFQGEPIYICAVDGGKHGKNFTLDYYKVGDEKRTIHHILSDNSDIDMNPVPLGLLSVKEGKLSTGMVSRLPKRFYKVGLTRGNVTVTPVNHDKPCVYRNAYSSLLMSLELRDTIMNSYPSYSEARKAAESSGYARAFSRRFATDGEKLYYKSLGLPCGEVRTRDCKLDENFFFLKEALAEDMEYANR